MRKSGEEAKPDRALQAPGDHQGQQQHGDDAQRQQPVAQAERRHVADVLDDAGLAGAEHFGPRPDVFHRQHQVDTGEAGIGLGHDVVALEDELDTHRVAGRPPAPDAGAVRSELRGERAQDVRHQLAGVRFHRQHVQRTFQRVDLPADQLLRGQQRLLGALARLDVGIGAVPLEHPAGVVQQRRVAEQEPAVFTVGTAHPRLQFARCALLQRIAPLRFEAGHVVRVDGGRPSPAEGGVHRYAGVFAPLLVEEFDRTFGAAEPGQPGDGVDRDAEAFLPRLQVTGKGRAGALGGLVGGLAHGLVRPAIRMLFRCCAMYSPTLLRANAIC